MKRFIIDQVGRVVRSGGETTADYPGLAEARMEVCRGCKFRGQVGIRGSFGLLSTEGCTLCGCPLITKTQTLFHRDYSNRIDWKLKNLVEVLDKENVPFVLTQCDLGKWDGTDHDFLGIRKIIQLNMTIVDSIDKFGYKRANPLACPTNVLRLEGKPECPELPVCEDNIIITAAAGKTISKFRVDGEYHDSYATDIKGNTRNVSVSADDEDGVCDSLYGVIRLLEVNILVDANMDGDDLNIRHVGQCKLEAVVLSDGTEIAATRKCNLTRVCTLAGNIPGADTPGLTVTDADGNAGNHTLTGDYTIVNDANATALQGEIQPLLPSDSAVSVTADTIASVYQVEVTVPEGYQVSLGGIVFTNCGCSEKFMA